MVLGPAGKGVGKSQKKLSRGHLSYGLSLEQKDRGPGTQGGADLPEEADLLSPAS